MSGNNLAALLRDTAEAIRPHIVAALELRDVFAEYRTAVTEAGGDWMALKNLVKAQIEDERDEDGGERVAKLLARADLAAAYADILKLNENNSFATVTTGDVSPVDATDAIETERVGNAGGSDVALGDQSETETGAGARIAPAPHPNDEDLEIPTTLRRGHPDCIIKDVVA